MNEKHLNLSKILLNSTLVIAVLTGNTAPAKSIETESNPTESASQEHLNEQNQSALNSSQNTSSEMLDQQLDEQSLESVSPLAIAPSNLPPPIAPSSYSLSLDASPTPSTPLNADLIPELSLAIATANFTGRELSFAELLQARSAITELYTKFSARVDWGIPLVDVDSGDRTWQENGIYLSLRYTSF